MAINYTKVGWDTTKYVNPSNMNRMDNGIKAACDGVDGILANYIKANNNVLQKIALSSGAGGTVLQLQSRASTLETWLQFLDVNGASVGSIGAKGNKPYFRDDNSVKEIALAEATTGTITAETGATISSNASSLKKMGVVCVLSVYGTVSNMAVSTAYKVATIPSGFRPTHTTFFTGAVYNYTDGFSQKLMTGYVTKDGEVYIRTSDALPTNPYFIINVTFMAS